MATPRLFKPQNNKGYFGRFFKYYGIIFLVLAVFVFGVFIGQHTSKVIISPISGDYGQGNVYNKKDRPDFLNKDLDFNVFWEIWDIIEENYLRQPVAETELLYGAMVGSVASLGDPHSVFFNPDMSQEFTRELKGNFEGIGAEIAIKNERLTIIAPLPDSPAERAGLRSGDKVYAINDEDTTGISLDYAVSKIRGPKGTEVVLTISRNGLDDLQKISVVRETIKIKSVSWQKLDNNIVLLEVRYFNEDTLDDFTQAVMDIVAKSPKSIILDLRNNPGGFLDVAVGVASEWVENSVVVYERASDGKLKKHEAKGNARFKDFKTVVLINKGSASGSEIVAGALKDYGLATLIGETTFGKGSVQSLFPLTDGSSVKLTIAEWLTPNENVIDGQGIDPDVEVELSIDDFNGDLDPQLDKAVEVLMAEGK